MKAFETTQNLLFKTAIMKKLFISPLFLLVVFCELLNAQDKVKGVVKGSDNNPIPGVIVVNSTKNIETTTDVKGEFEIHAVKNDVIKVSFVGYVTNEFVIADDKVKLIIQLAEEKGDLNQIVVAAVSPRSYWLGATVAYNVDGAEVDNIVGSAKIGINPVERRHLGAYWGIVGNFANFISAQNKEKTNKDLLKVAQSSQGLSIGIAGTWEVLPSTKDFNFRFYLTTGYRLNAFQKVGEDSISVGLSQFRNSLGIEFEGLKFKNGGKLHFSFEGSLAAFSQNKYELVFGEKKSSLSSLEITAILPIAQNIGFLANGTYCKNFASVYQFGIIFKDLK
jgi:hypothetical protein